MIEVGDRVELLDDVLSGVVTIIEGEKVTIETDDGFLMVLKISEVVKIQSLHIDRRQLAKAVKVKKEGVKKSIPVASKKKMAVRPLVVDLHAEKLTGTSNHMSDFDILNLQLQTAEGQLKFAMRKNIRRVVFIHGVGKGVLKMELETLLRRFKRVEFYDADFAKYGMGATEVYIYQNP